MEAGRRDCQASAGRELTPHGLGFRRYLKRKLISFHFLPRAPALALT